MEIRARRIARWDKAYYAYEEPDEPCPTLAQLRRAFARARRSEADKAALAGMLRLAEQYHGRHVYDDDSPGFYRMKGLRHFMSGDPVLAKHYKTLMRYKNLVSSKAQASFNQRIINLSSAKQ